MSEPFIAEIRIFAGNFAPRHWAFCNGQLLPIAQNTALFSLIGTIYGGDGRTTTALPNLQGRAPMHAGRGPGLSDRRLGQAGGVTQVTLTEAQIPAHNHVSEETSSVEADLNAATTGDPTGAFNAADTRRYGDARDLERTGATAGGGQHHTNMQPYLGLNFIIALVGIYPSRS